MIATYTTMDCIITLQEDIDGHLLQTLTGFIAMQRSRGDIGRAQPLILRGKCRYVESHSDFIWLSGSHCYVHNADSLVSFSGSFAFFIISHTFIVCDVFVTKEDG